MDITIYAVPAILALGAKAIIYFYARFSRLQNLQTRLYLLFLFSLSIQNLAEIAAFSAHARGLTAPPGGILYFGASILAIGFLLHLAWMLAGQPRPAGIRGPWLPIAVIYLPAMALEGLLWATPLIVTGFEPLNYTYTKIPGPLYFLFEFYAIGYLCGVVGLLFYGGRMQPAPSKRAQNKLMLFGILPPIVVVLAVVALQHFGMRAFNTTVTLPLALTFLLAVTAYATHQYRLFDIQFYIPWSKVRKRKTAFYERIRALVAEIADLNSPREVIERLADTLRCPVALIGGNRPVLATAGGSQFMSDIPRDMLRGMDRIVVANEIEDRMPAVHAIMQRHGIAAIVPFYPHSQNASGWLLLGDSFSEQVYTRLDFKVVEHLFDKMAELFLDKLLTLRTQLADAAREIRAFEQREQHLTTRLALLEGENSTLRHQNERLLKEQPVDSLAGDADSGSLSPERVAATITVLGRDRHMYRALRRHFPQSAHFVGADSAGFRRQSPPDVLVCHLPDDAQTGRPSTAEQRLRETIVDGGSACVLYGPGAAEFVARHKKALIGTLTETMPADVTEEALARKIQALAALRTATYAVTEADEPLIGHSLVFRDQMAEAGRVAGFVEPVVLVTSDMRQAVALAAYMHGLSPARGKFNVLYTDGLTSGEIRQALSSGLDDTGLIPALLRDTRGGTLMIAGIRGLPETVLTGLFDTVRRVGDIRVVLGVTRDAGAGALADTGLAPAFQAFTLRIPGLPERRQDIPLLVHYFTLQFNLQAGTHHSLRQSEIDELLAANYPKDVATLKRAVFELLKARLVGSNTSADTEIALAQEASDKTLDEHVAEFEARIIAQTLARCDGNKSRAARLLGLRPNTLHYKLERYGIAGVRKP